MLATAATAHVRLARDTANSIASRALLHQTSSLSSALLARSSLAWNRTPTLETPLAWRYAEMASITDSFNATMGISSMGMGAAQNVQSSLDGIAPQVTNTQLVSAGTFRTLCPQ